MSTKFFCLDYLPLHDEMDEQVQDSSRHLWIPYLFGLPLQGFEHARIVGMTMRR